MKTNFFSSSLVPTFTEHEWQSLWSDLIRTVRNSAKKHSNSVNIKGLIIEHSCPNVYEVGSTLCAISNEAVFHLSKFPVCQTFLRTWWTDVREETNNASIYSFKIFIQFLHI